MYPIQRIQKGWTWSLSDYYVMLRAWQPFWVSHMKIELLYLQIWNDHWWDLHKLQLQCICHAITWRSNKFCRWHFGHFFHRDLMFYQVAQTIFVKSFLKSRLRQKQFDKVKMQFVRNTSFERYISANLKSYKWQ